MAAVIRVARLPGHPVVTPERHATRPSPMHPTPPPLFPDWFATQDVLAHFEPVDRDPDAVVVTMSYHLTTDDLARVLALRTPTVPLVVVYTLDDLDEPARGGWQRDADWAKAIRSFALSADLLVGAQLPVHVRHPNVLPLPHAPVVPFTSAPGRVCSASTDLYFAGAWYPPERPGVPPDSRDRTHRGYLVERLRSGLPTHTVELRRVHYWRTNPLQPGGPPPADDVKPDLLRRHAAALDATRLALAPVGYGYYTTRHSDALARGRPLLTEPIHRRLLLPEPDRWASGELATYYDPAADDIVAVVTEALRDPVTLQAKADAGWAYAQRHLRPDRQVRTLATAIRALLGH